jgi:hypothetical protein
VARVTRKKNIFFVKIGLAALAGAFLIAILNAVLFYFGLQTSVSESLLEILFPLSAMVSFICLGWFGLMPRVGTKMFLWRMFDAPGYEYMYTFTFHRFVFLITDDRRVLAKLATKGTVGGAG